jgi:hypothetical protein
VLAIRDTVFGTYILDQGGRLLVAQHGKVGPKVVLNLVVQKAVHKVDQVCSHAVVDRSENLTKIKGSRKGTATIMEPIHVVSSMVGHNGDESVDVGEEVGIEQVLDGGPVHAGSSVAIQVLSKEQKRKGSDKEMKDKVRSHDNSHEFLEGIKGAGTKQNIFKRDGSGRIDSFWNGLSFATEFGQLEFLHGIMRTIHCPLVPMVEPV